MPPPPLPLTTKKLLRLYLPLALTFLLMAGSSPFINKGIGKLPNETIGLAAFANAFVICLFLYSPCFAVRDAAQKFVRGRTSYRRVLVFHLCVSTACTIPLLVVSLTPLLDEIALRGLMAMPDALIGPVKRAVLAFVAVPTLITLRGVHQAVHITNDTPNWIGIGTVGRFTMILLFVFLVGVPRGMEGAVMGGLALSLGMGTEMVVTLVTARRLGRFLHSDPDEPSPPDTYGLWRFCGPLFLANIMGVCLQPIAVAIVNSALAPETSSAAFGVVKSFTWFFTSTLFAMQAMALAKADSVANLKRLLAFEMIPAGLFSLLILLTAFVPPVREAVLSRFFEIDDPRTARFATEAMPFALALPVLMALRSTARGLLLRGGRTYWVTLGSLTALVTLIAIRAAAPTVSLENGATVGYVCWMGVMGFEMVVLVFAVAKVGVETCVSEGATAPPPVQP